MKEEIIIAGFGGQGVLSMGKILAYSGLMENINISSIIAVTRTMIQARRLESLVVRPSRSRSSLTRSCRSMGI